MLYTGLLALALVPALAVPRQDLVAGEYAVGFQSSWALDWGRCYRTELDEGTTYGRERAPRPVLVLSWYPARQDATARPMTRATSRSA